MSKREPAPKKASTTRARSDRKQLNPRMRRAVAVLVSTATALFVLSLAATVLVAGLVREAPSAQPVPGAEVEVGAGPLSLVCPDTPRLITDVDGADIDYDAEFGPSPEGVAASTEVLVLGRDGQDPGHANYRALAGEEASELTRLGSVAMDDYPGGQAPGVLTAEPSQGQSAFGVGTALARADAGDLRGLSAAPCQVPSSALWLVGGSTELGSSARLTLTNPGQTPVTADVGVWGATGPVEGSATVLVAPGSARVVLLETLSLEERMAVRVTSDGGRLTAAIQDSTLRGVVPAGTDMVTATADPTADLRLGPFLAPGPDEQDEATPVLRLVNPEAEEVQVSVSLWGEDGPSELPGAQDQVLEPGTVTDISLAGIPAGPVALQVSADAPVTGSVLLTRIGQAGELDPSEPVRDRAWVGAQGPQRHALLGLPAMQEEVDQAEIALTNALATAQTIQVRAVAADGTLGDPVDVALEPESSALLATDLGVSEPAAVEITGEAFLATATLTAQAEDGELISVLAATPDGNLDQYVTVRLGSS